MEEVPYLTGTIFSQRHNSHLLITEAFTGTGYAFGFLFVVKTKTSVPVFITLQAQQWPSGSDAGQ